MFTFKLQKYLEVEDAVEGEKKELQDKVESLESIVRMLELKSKNAADHGKIFAQLLCYLLCNCNINEYKF